MYYRLFFPPILSSIKPNEKAPNPAAIFKIIPNKNISLQLGNPKLISNFFKIQVISNFRINDIKNGGQGAPIGAFYHKHLIEKINKFLSTHQQKREEARKNINDYLLKD